MRLLHTADWHLGRKLYGKKRDPELQQFLAWLLQTIDEQDIDVLLVAGDIFDTTTPNNQAQSIYYQFLSKVAVSHCQHVVITAGNHDSPSFLEAPKRLLQALHIHVIGNVSEQLHDEVITLYNRDGYADAIICAVPYLRDKAIRTAAAGESIDDKNRQLVAGIKRHYAEVVELAEKQRLRLQSELPDGTYVPIIASGHLFTAGGKTLENDGVRELYVGNLAHVGSDIFPACVDYVALGHLHVPQTVGDSDFIRYCGSPIAMGFGEAKQRKQVVVVDFSKTMTNATATGSITTIAVPCFQQLVRLCGTATLIETEIQALKQADSSAWLEIEYTEKQSPTALRQHLDELLADSELEVLRLKTRLADYSLLSADREHETLDDLTVEQMFERCLSAYDIAEAEREPLRHAHHEVVKSLQEEDSNHGGE